jgi:hypothetical protein
MTRLLVLLLLLLLPVAAQAQSTSVKFDSAASTNATLVLAGTTQVRLITATNTSASVAYLKLYNTAVAPTCGSGTVVFKIAIPATSGQLIVPIDGGLVFSNGIGFCLTGASIDSDTTAVLVGTSLNFAVKQ